MLHEPTIIITLILSVLLLSISKKYILLPFIIAACFIPADQRIVIMGLDFTMLRILVGIGFLRHILRTEQLTFKLSNFDKLVIGWALCGAVIYVIQWADMRSLIYKCGMLFDIIGMYWIFRLNINSWNDIKLLIKIFAICSLILSVFVAYEWITGSNPFTFVGRVTTVVREGRYRCQASFPHSIILGLFWATIFPIFIGIARTNKHKTLYWLSAASSVFIVAATASSTPYLTLFMIIIILLCYRWRKYVPITAWLIFISLIMLQFFLQGPVWSLIAKMNVVSGSTGIHRFRLINQAIRHINEWALLGCRSTSSWGRGLGDVTNQYILEGVQGGLITLIIFLIMLYEIIKRLLNLSFLYHENTKRILVWCILVSILGNCISFMGVSYFGQIRMLWYLILACCAFIIREESIFTTRINKDLIKKEI